MQSEGNVKQSKDYLEKTISFCHQAKVFLKSRLLIFFALLMEQGTGKTKVVIDTVAYLFCQGKVDALLVIAPNGVHQNWIDTEVPAHLPDYIDRVCAWWTSSANKEERAALDGLWKYKTSRMPLHILAINVEALAASPKAYALAEKFLNSHRCLMAVDESVSIKNHKAQRTIACLKLGKKAAYRRILSGTLGQSPLDLYSPFEFLDPTILRHSSWYSFRGEYAYVKEIEVENKHPKPGQQHMKKYKVKIVTGYRNLGQLQNLIAPHSFRVLKADCLDLPPKLYQKRLVPLSPAQEKIYKQLKAELLAEFSGRICSTPLELTKLLRLEQVIGGYFVADPEYPEDDDVPDSVLDVILQTQPIAIDKVNPRIVALLEILEEVAGKVIIMTKFRPEITAIKEALVKVYGREAVVEYHGGIALRDRKKAMAGFQEQPAIRYFLCSYAAYRGITLTAANTMIYYNQDSSLDKRLQSEDRPHRIGTKTAVVYIDMIAPGTYDAKKIAALRENKKIQDLITGDCLRDWI